MLRSTLRPQGWARSRCLLRNAAPIHHQRELSLFSRAASAVSPDIAPRIPVTHAPGGIQQNDELLRKIFDDKNVWDIFSAPSRQRQTAGLFRNPYLRRPDGFLTYADISLKRARAIVERVLAASTVEEYRAVVRQLDRLSDILCRVLDMSDFVRVSHPDYETRLRANDAWEMVYRYMNELNTMTGLNDQLGKAMENPDVTSAWSEEEMTVAQVLKLDFTKSAVNLPQKNRDQFVELSSEISQVGNLFMQEMEPETRFTRLSNFYKPIPSVGPQASEVLRTVKDEATRRAVYIGSRTASKKCVNHLNRLMRLRSQLARLSGFESYGHLALRDRMMAKDPESVKEFLQALSTSNLPAVQQEVADLLAEKAKSNPSATTVEPWDKDYYSEAIRFSLRSKRRYDDFIHTYFSLGTVIQGMSRLFTRLYGIRLEPREALPGETWHSYVRRLDVISDVDGHVAVLYCDLFYHPEKQPNPAHFTLRCSREILEDELAEYGEMLDTDEGKKLFTSREDAANDGMAFSTQSGAVKQLPTIVLTCDFPTTSHSKNGPALLTFPQVETLFHEMGHAIHSVLARTSFQNVAGTRCATDLAELPSTLMEYFAADPTVLGMFARHYETDKPLDYGLVVDHLRQSRRFEALDTENQIILAMLDQALHSEEASNPALNSTAVYHRIQREYSSLGPDPPETRWQGFFGHLFGYGSTYYSYLFDRVLAQRVWNVVFKGGREGAALDRKNGEHLKENLLKWGGGRDPWRCLASTLREDRLADGGKEAMALVGSWGAGSHLEK
ncbi:mitochondrial intermediate peptidase [Naviculisporaceae sp. PSN 640]